MTTVHIALVGDHDSRVTAHRAIPDALRLASMSLGSPVTWDWIGTETLEAEVTDALRRASGIWLVPNSPYRSETGALQAVRYARESGRPYLGTCAGFQHAVLEGVRHVAGVSRAAHAEVDPDSPLPVISLLTCGLVEQAGEIVIEPDSRLGRAYGTTCAMETYHCNYGLNPRYEHLLEGSALRITARDEGGDVRAVEGTGPGFFVATLFQPERAALLARAHPLVNAFVGAAA